MNWGKRILFLYLAFVAGIVLLVVKSHGKSVDLVAKDYYEQELKYSDRMTALQNYQNLQHGVEIRQKSTTIQIALPIDHSVVENLSVFFYKASDPTADKLYEVAPNEKGIITLDKRLLQPGKYDLKLDWTHNNMPFAFQQSIIVH